MSVIPHDPDATLDYQVDWSDWLGADTISSVAWSVDGDDSPSEIALTGETNTTTTATVTLAGGTLGRVYRLTCRITTTASRTADRTITIRCMNQ